METLQFLVALGIGVLLGTSGLGLGWTVLWCIVSAFVLTVINLVIQGLAFHQRLPMAMRSPYGLTVPPGKFRYLFFGTITTIGVATVIVALIVR